MGKANALSFSGFWKAINIVHRDGPTQKLAQKGSDLDGSVDLRPELAVVHDLKERMQRRRRNESGAALSILPDDRELSGKSRAWGCGLEGSVRAHLVGFRKRDQQGGSSDLQMGDGNRTI
jgi:hypothetical protein